MASDGGQQFRELVATVAAAYFSNSRVPPHEVRAVISDIAGALVRAGEATGADLPAVEPQPQAVEPRPAQLTARPKPTPAQIAASIAPQGLISFEDGRAYKTLRRHLKHIGITEGEYRARWGLPDDYPMVSPDYSSARSRLAKSIGLSERAAMARRKESQSTEVAKPRRTRRSREATQASA